MNLTALDCVMVPVQLQECLTEFRRHPHLIHREEVVLTKPLLPKEGILTGEQIQILTEVPIGTVLLLVVSSEGMGQLGVFAFGRGTKPVRTQMTQTAREIWQVN